MTPNPYPFPPFIQRLADALSRDPLREKLVIAPNHRVGRQWLDRAAAAGRGVVNARVATSRRVMLDWAAPELRAKGLRTAPPAETLAVMGGILDRLRTDDEEQRYFSNLPSSLDLVRSLAASVEELDSAGAWSVALRRVVRPQRKAQELAVILRMYAGEMAKAGLAGPGMAAKMAAKAAAAVRHAGGTSKPAPLAILPRSLLEQLSGLEQAFWEAWPDALAIDDSGEPDCASVKTFVADHPGNEARAVLRAAVESGLPLDAMEVVCADAATYTPKFIEAGLELFGGGVDDIPFTFAGGIPVFYTRPARLLTAWLEWLEGGTHAEGLARVVDAGLLGDAWSDAAGGRRSHEISERIRAFPCVRNLRLLRPMLDGNALARRDMAVARWVVEFLDIAIPGGASGEKKETGDSQAPRRAAAMMAAADAILSRTSRGDGKLDAYARTALRENITEWRRHAAWSGFDAATWLAETAHSLKVMGFAPMPGRLHIADIRSGGHSGRDTTFLAGFDDSRFPGAVRQDPIFLDRERRSLSPALRLSMHRRERREKEFAILLARLRGNVVASHSRSDGDGGELFPSAAFLSLAKQAEQPKADDTATACLAPSAAAQCLSRRDDWLAALPRNGNHNFTVRDLAPWHANLFKGEAARVSRSAIDFTEYDGNVPQAGADFEAERDSRILSPSVLERLAANPLEYFFRHCLGVRPPDRYRPSPGRWLEGRQRGNLMHDLVRDFLNHLGAADGEAANPLINEETLLSLLMRYVREYKSKFPPADFMAFHREEGELAEACRIFLAGELERSRSGRPVCLEVTLGGSSSMPTPWDREDPVALPLPSSRSILMTGRIDRVDRRLDGGGLVIIDYKTGRSDKFSLTDPFMQGRHLQPLLYVHMLSKALEERGRPEPVRGFTYVFPMPRDEGRTISYSRDVLKRDALAVVDNLVSLMESGCFPLTTSPADLAYSDYAAVYEASGDGVAAARRKALGSANPGLDAWRELRELQQ